MPAQVAIVLDEAGLADKVVEVLKATGYDAASLPNSMTALEALEGATKVEILITSLHHGPGNPNGIALARMARARKPGIKVMFVGDPALAHHADGLGAFLSTPVTVQHIVGHAIGMLD